MDLHEKTQGACRKLPFEISDSQYGAVRKRYAMFNSFSLPGFRCIDGSLQPVPLLPSKGRNSGSRMLLSKVFPDFRILFFQQSAAGTFISIDKFTEFPYLFCSFWKKHIRIFFVILRLDFHVSSQNITPKTAIQQMWSTEIFW